MSAVPPQPPQQSVQPVRPWIGCTFRPPRAMVRLSGDFDIASRDHLADVLACLRGRGCTRVEVDAHEVSFVDAACLRVLQEEAMRLGEAGGVLRLVAASVGFVRVVEAAGYRDLLPAAATPMPPPPRPASGHEPDRGRGDPARPTPSPAP